MITVQETTKWDGNYDNHQYILSDDKRWMYGFIRAGEKYPKLFNNPIGFDTRGRTFTLIVQTKDVTGDKRVWHITGSKGDIYTVSNRDNNWKCSCPAAMFRGKTCKHVEEVQQSLGS
jgi:hypothetical protein